MDAPLESASPALSIDVTELRAALATFPPPQLLDVRRPAAFERDPVVIGGAIRVDDVARLAHTLEPWRPVVTVCVHGHEVSQLAAATLRGAGYAARWLSGGLEAWKAAGGAVQASQPPSRWVTRERPKIDRIACPWLVRRFIDASATFHYVPAAQVQAFAEAERATPFDVPDTAYSHHGERCSFDAFVERHDLRDPALHSLAAIVRAADTGALSDAAEAAGLLAVSVGLSRMISDDLAMLRHGMLVYDALYLRCRDAAQEAHAWNVAALRDAAAGVAR